MKIRRKSPLTLTVNAFRAADLFLAHHADKPKAVNASLVAKLNGYKKRCRRKLHTSNPSWDYSFHIPLNFGDCSDVLVLAVWNRGARSKTYMGEVRLQLSALFGDGAFKTQATWHKLYSSESKHEYVTGSVLLSFELSHSKSRDDRPESAGELPAKLARSRLDDGGKNDDGSKHADGSSPASDDTASLFQQWLDSLMIPERAMAVAPNDQGFYSHLPVSFSLSGTSDVSDLDSLADSGARISDVLDKSGDFSELAVPSASAGDRRSPYAGLGAASLNSGSSAHSDSEASSVAYVSDSGLYSTEVAIAGTKKPRPRRLGRRKAASKYELANRNVEGVLFLEIVSCSDLPPIKNFTHTSFDMDPFVVVTFGKKTFRTSWKRHNLNPIYNERLAFEVLEPELNYNVQFSVLDKDRFSFHDQVADVSTSIRELIEIAREPEKDHGDPDPEPAAEPAVHFAKDYSMGDAPHARVDGGGDGDGGAESDESASDLYEPRAGASASDVSSHHPAIEVASDGNYVRTRRKKFIRRKTTVSYVDTSLFKTLNLGLRLRNEKMAAKHKPSLKVRARFITYDHLRRDFWKILLEQYSFDEPSGAMDYIELISFLDTLASNHSDEIVGGFFRRLGKSTWGGDKVSFDQIADCLEEFVTQNTDPSKKIFEVDRCPICCRERFSNKDNLDIVTHVAICTSKDWSIVNKLLSSSYVTPQLASRRWFSKALIKLTYGKYKLGSNNANILVQDRSTGLILEEKMSITVRLGIRLLYRGLDKAKSKRIRILLQKLSVKQGAKFDSPASARDIPSFIQFHKLSMDDCEVTDPRSFRTFNEFFYRKLRPGARPAEAPAENRIAVSPADCRCTTFGTVDQATELWIKGRNFTIAKLFNGNFNNLDKTDLFRSDRCSVGIFRLAPQDYHRFHSPVKGTIGPMKYIEGEYYTVNPMAVRSDLDVYGENVRVIVPIETAEFGTVVLVAVGAMMVGSTVITVQEGQAVERGDEVGYFKFGGSTVLLLFSSDKLVFDSDLVNNSTQCVETLVRVGQSIGHSPAVAEYKRERVDFSKQPKDLKLSIIRAITGGDVDDDIKLDTWETKRLQITPQDVDDLDSDSLSDMSDSL